MLQKYLAFFVLAAVLLLGCTQGGTATASASGQPHAASVSPDAMKKDSPTSIPASVDSSGGSQSPIPSGAPSGGVYEPFTQAHYDAARAAGKAIFLEFYANWCPVCKEQEPQIESAFQSGISSKVAGFRVNYNDDQTTDVDRALARQFGVSYQHTHVILDAGGNVKTKSLEFWDSSRVQAEIAKVTG